MCKKKTTLYLRLKGENADIESLMIIRVFYIMVTRKPQGKKVLYEGADRSLAAAGGEQRGLSKDTTEGTLFLTSTV